MLNRGVSHAQLSSSAFTPRSKRCHQCAAIWSGLLHKETDSSVKWLSDEVFVSLPIVDTLTACEDGLMCKHRRTDSLSQIIIRAVRVTPLRKYTDQLCIHSRVSLILLLRNPYRIVYFWKWPHTYTHEPNIHGRRRSARSTSRPQSPCYSQNDDITTAISISDLEPGYLKPTRQLLCKSLFGPLSHPAFTPVNKTGRRNKLETTHYKKTVLDEDNVVRDGDQSALIQI